MSKLNTFANTTATMNPPAAHGVDVASNSNTVTEAGLDSCWEKLQADILMDVSWRFLQTNHTPTLQKSLPFSSKTDVLFQLPDS